MKINKMLQSVNASSRYGESVKYIVIHYVGAISSARNNCIYFKNGYRGASAHFFVDSEIWQSVPCSRASWHCGGGLQDTGRAMTGGNRGATLHGICTNQNSIGIELCCHRDKLGRIVPSLTAIKTAIPLVKWLMEKYGVPASHVIRHFDVTGKCCPNGYTSASTWAELHKTLTGKSASNNAHAGGSALKHAHHGKYGTYEDKDKKLGLNRHSDGRYLIKGDHGSKNVMRLQRFLNWYGRNSLDVDGIFGSATKEAVKDFQRSHGLMADGIVGKATLAVIHKYYKGA